MSKCKMCERFFKSYRCGATLLGECDCPKCQGMCKCAVSSGFERFWSAWPKHPRKGAKAACLAKWTKTYCETQADQIVKHVEWMKTTEQWRKDNGAYIPAPLVYLNQQRWDGAEIPEIKKPVLMIDEYKERMANVTSMPEHIKARLAQLKRGS